MAETPPNRILLVPVDDTEVEKGGLPTIVRQQSERWMCHAGKREGLGVGTRKYTQAGSANI